MRVAFVATDPKKLSSHFGEAPQFLIYDVEGQEAKFVEVRENPVKDEPGYFHHHNHEERTEHGRGLGRGTGHGGGRGRGKWHYLADLLNDCEVIIGRGMGPAAYENFRSIGKKIILTKEIQVEEALRKFLAGELQHDERRVKWD